MMRIAIAGGGGFSYILAGEITQSANPVLVISRQVGAPHSQPCICANRIYSPIPSLKRTSPDARLPW